MNILRNQQTVNGAKPPVTVSKRPTGRELAMNAIRLRVFLGVELRRLADTCQLDPDHYSASAVTSLAISLEKQGVRGIPEECDVVVK